MKNKSLKMMISALICGITFASCNGGTGGGGIGGGIKNSPQAIQDAYFTHVKQGAYEKAVEIWYDYMNSKTKEERGYNTPEAKSKYIADNADRIKRGVESMNGLKSWVLTEEKFFEDGEKADLIYILTGGNGQESHGGDSFIKEDGQWKYNHRY